MAVRGQVMTEDCMRDPMHLWQPWEENIIAKNIKQLKAKGVATLLNQRRALHGLIARSYQSIRHRAKQMGVKFEQLNEWSYRQWVRNSGYTAEDLREPAKGAKKSITKIVQVVSPADQSLVAENDRLRQEVAELRWQLEHIKKIVGDRLL